MPPLKSKGASGTRGFPKKSPLYRGPEREKKYFILFFNLT
jgi:hypothetical protein